MMEKKAKVAVLISGRGSNMAALVYAAKRPDCPFEIVLVASNDPEAQGLQFAQAEGIATFALSHRGLKRAEFDAVIDTELRKAGADYVALRSEEHTSELQSLMRTSYAVFCLKKK